MMAEQLKPANHLITSLIFLLFKLFQFFSSFYIPLTRPKLAEIWFSSEKRVCTLSPECNVMMMMMTEWITGCDIEQSDDVHPAFLDCWPSLNGHMAPLEDKGVV